jgi:hypothetical protein
MNNPKTFLTLRLLKNVVNKLMFEAPNIYQVKLKYF